MCINRWMVGNGVSKKLFYVISLCTIPSWMTISSRLIYALTQIDIVTFCRMIRNSKEKFYVEYIVLG